MKLTFFHIFFKGKLTEGYNNNGYYKVMILSENAVPLSNKECVCVSV